MGLYHIRVASTVMNDYAVVAESAEEAKAKGVDIAERDDLGGAQNISHTVVFCEEQ